MKNQWIQTTLSSCVKLQSGGTPSKKNPDYWGGDIPWVSSKDFKCIRIYDTQDHITDLAVEHGAKLVSPGTILLAVRGMRLAKELPVAELQCTASFNQDLKALHCTELISPRFLLYWLIASSHKVLGKCDEAAHGTKRLQTELLLSIPIELPTLPTQQRIAEILSTYDNAIANNNQRIALLEESIHQLYKEWFVRLRFPGYESVKVVDGVPEGWNKVPATQTIDFKPKTLAPKKELRPYVPMEAVSTNSMILTGIQTRPVGGGAKFKNGDTLLARITPCLENGKTAFVQFMDDADMVATGSTEFIVMRSIKVTPHWVYCLARSHNFRQHAINSMAGSDGRQRVKPDCFEQYQVLFPPPKILKYFNNVSTPIFKQIKYLNLQNQKFKEARDLLLPRLMNGKITV